MIDPAICIAILAVLIAALQYIFNRYKYQVEYNSKLSDYQIKTEGRLRALETTVNIFLKGIEVRMASYIHSPHTPEIDIFLDKIKAEDITYPEIQQLHSRLETNLQEGVYEEEKKLGAIILLARLDQVIHTANTVPVLVPEKNNDKAKPAHKFSIKWKGN